MNKSKVKIGDVKKVKDQEYICKGFSTSGNPIWRKRDAEIEKGYQVGDEKDFNGRTYYVHELNAKGAPKWRLKKDGGSKQNDGSGNKPATQQNSGSGNKPQSDSQNQPQAQQQTKPAAPQKKVEDMDVDELVAYAKNASTDALSKMVNDTKADKSLRQLAFNELKTRSDYDKTKVNSEDLDGGHVPVPKAKIQYQTKKPEIEVSSVDFEDYEIPTQTGGRVKVSISKTRKNYATRSDADVLKILNNPKANPKLRQIAYEEAAARGIPEDQIKINGTLKSMWKQMKDEADLLNARNKAVDPDEAAELTYDWKGLDHETIMKEEFDGGEDPEWLNPNSDRVKRIFKTETLSGRQRYDTFLDYYQRNPDLNPGYLNSQDKVDNLNGEMYQWGKSDSAALFISAGGAGAGKSYGWKEIVAPTLNLPKLQAGQNPEDTDWGYVMLSNEQAEDEKKFAETLAKYNGTYMADDGSEHPHILVFDDADKLIITKSKGLQALMKKINDPDQENRIFTNPSTGEQEVWRGKIIIMTNKDTAQLQNNNPDATAIFSRATVSDIKFTRNETMELLANRYMTMGLDDCEQAFKDNNFTDDEIEEFRQDVYDYMLKHIGEADPAKFTPRAFISLARHIAPRWKGSSQIKTGKGNIGVDKPWRLTALSIIKASDNDIEKADYEDGFSKEALIAKKKAFEDFKKEAKKEGVYDKLFSKEAQDAFLFGGKDSDSHEDGGKKPAKSEKKSNKKTAKKSEEKPADDDAKKGFDDEMSLDEAEEILFNL